MLRPGTARTNRSNNGGGSPTTRRVPSPINECAQNLRIFRATGSPGRFSNPPPCLLGASVEVVRCCALCRQHNALAHGGTGVLLATLPRPGLTVRLTQKLAADRSSTQSGTKPLARLPDHCYQDCTVDDRNPASPNVCVYIHTLVPNVLLLYLKSGRISIINSTTNTARHRLSGRSLMLEA